MGVATYVKLACALGTAGLLGCGSAVPQALAIQPGVAVSPGLTVQPGLANAPESNVPPGTPELHVHDAVANGPDSCEGSGPAQGEVLRGHLPPCATEARPTPAMVPPVRAASEPPLQEPLGSVRTCWLGSYARPSGYEKGLTAFPLSVSWGSSCVLPVGPEK